MTYDEAQKLDHGIYRLFWKDGTSSLAAVGSLHNGRRWFAPTNWTSEDAAGVASMSWRLVDDVEMINRKLD